MSPDFGCKSPLSELDLDALHFGSGISAEVISQRRAKTITGDPAELRELGIRSDAGPGVWFPFYDIEGREVYGQFRLAHPTPAKNGKTVKYLNPFGKAVRVDYVPALSKHVRDGNAPIVITEGCKKGDSFASWCISHGKGYGCIVLAGVWNWCKDGKALSDMENISWSGRTVFVAFDSDVMWKRSVSSALRALGDWLKSHGADVRYVLLPDGGDGKMGLDDYLVKDPSPEGLEDIFNAAAAEPPGGVARERPRWGDFLSVADMLASSSEETDWIWQGVLPVGGVALFCAKPKVGKSTLLRDLARCVARGVPFLGRATQKGNVMYLAIEETPQLVIPEIRRVGWEESDNITLRFGSAPIGRHQEIVAELRQIVVERGISLLIVDTIGRLARVKQGNDYAEVTQALEPLVDLARGASCAVVMTHHLGKSDRDTGDGSLGSTAYFAAVDVCIELKRVDGVRVLDSVARAGEPFESQTLAFDDQTHRLTLGGKLADIQAQGLEAELLTLLAELGPMSRDSLKSKVRGNAQAISDAFVNLRNAGRIVQVSGSGKKGDARLYGIPVPSSETGSELETEMDSEDVRSSFSPLDREQGTTNESVTKMPDYVRTSISNARRADNPSCTDDPLHDCQVDISGALVLAEPEESERL